MFEKTSRYDKIETATMTITDSDGQTRIIAYKRRRFLPRLDSLQEMVRHTVSEGDRLDNITADYLGDPTQFWRLCDANLVLHPLELTDEIGSTIVIALPQG